jgi:Flp pilus assembly protein TadG
VRQPFGRRRARSAGQGLVEFALAIPIFLLVVLAIMEGASYGFAVTTLQSAAQHGARLAALPLTEDEAAVETEVIEHAGPVAVSTSQIAVSVNGGGTTFADRETGDRVRVTIAFAYRPLTSVLFGGAVFSLAAAAEYVVE